MAASDNSAQLRPADPLGRSVRLGSGSSSGWLRALEIALPLLAVLGIGTYALLGSPPSRDPVRIATVVILTLGIVVADQWPVQLSTGRKFSLGGVPAVAILLLVPGALAPALVAGARLAGELAYTRRLGTAAYVAGASGLAALAASLVASPTGMPDSPVWLVRAFAAAVLFMVLSLSLAGVATALQRGDRLGGTLARTFSISWEPALAGVGAGSALGVLALTAPPAALLFLALLPLLHRMNRSLETELRAREQLQSVLEAQRRFLTDVSHNVSNPLSTIRANLSLLKHGRLAAAAAAALADATTECDRLIELFRRLLTLAETDEGLPLNKGRIELAAMAGELVRLYAPSADRRGIELLTLAEGRPAVEGDENLLRQAAANLVENAIRYSPRGHTVVVRVAGDDRQAVLEVIDEGPGIPPEQMRRIFERFHHGPQGRSGLGLAIALSVVERHGGHIQVDSEPGAGSCFRILLPGLVGGSWGRPPGTANPVR
jgi:two-component system, OmpR family, sensor kinase